MQLSPYLSFDGNAAAAMSFYAELFGSRADIRYFSDVPASGRADAGARVMHAFVQVGTTTLMASDRMPGMPLVPGNDVHLNLVFDTADEQTRVFEALAAGGRVDVPLAEQFFGRFGMLTDRFGTRWMLLHQAQHAPAGP